MLDYTLLFLRRGDEILLLNRENSPYMGGWNGVGGKLEAGETPLQSVLREVREETGISLSEAAFKGTLTWEVNGIYSGGLYLFAAAVPEDFTYHTPVKTDEGILDWKKLTWIKNPRQFGIADNIPCFIDDVLFDEDLYTHHCVFRNNILVSVTRRPYSEDEKNG